MNLDSAPTGTSDRDRLSADWCDKLAGDAVADVEPFFQRQPVRTAMFASACLVGLLGAVAIGFFNRWHDDRLADLARQRACLLAFTRSPEFAEFGTAIDAQMLGTFNFIAVSPQTARAALPAVTEFETAHRLLPWSLQIAPLPASAAAEPARLARTGRAVSCLLARRGYGFDETARNAARHLFLRTLAPYAVKFLQRAPGNGFDALMLDRPMQESALAALGARHDAGVADMERLFGLYAAVGPSMWSEVERQRTAQNPLVFTASAR